MVITCIANGCPNKWVKEEVSKRSFHRFPFKNKSMVDRWVDNLRANKGDFIPKKNDYLCSDHFQKSCFQNDVSKRILKPDAVPTIFPNDKLKLASSAESLEKLTEIVSNEIDVQGSEHSGNISMVSGTQISSGSETSVIWVLAETVTPASTLVLTPSKTFHSSEAADTSTSRDDNKRTVSQAFGTKSIDFSKWDHSYESTRCHRTREQELEESNELLKKKLKLALKTLKENEKKFQILGKLITDLQAKNC